MRISWTIRSGMNENVSMPVLFVTLEESEIDCLDEVVFFLISLPYARQWGYLYLILITDY